jgi:hypothetical protein
MAFWVDLSGDEDGDALQSGLNTIISPENTDGIESVQM